MEFMEYRARPTPNYSALMLAARITLAHFSVSSATAFRIRPASSAWARRRARPDELATSGRPTPRSPPDLVSRRSRVACPWAPPSRTRCSLRSRARFRRWLARPESQPRVSPQSRRAYALAGPDVPDRTGNVVEQHLHLAGHQVGIRGRRGPVRHMNKIDAGHYFEQLA